MRAAEGHLALGHHLEQRRLHLGRGPVDLVGQDEVGEHRAELDVEALGRGPVDAGADEVGRDQVGGELDAGERAAERLGQRRHGQRLAQAGHALEQAVAVGEQGHEHPLEHPVLADDDPAQLEQHLLELAAPACATDIGRAAVVGTVSTAVPASVRDRASWVGRSARVVAVIGLHLHGFGDGLHVVVGDTLARPRTITSRPSSAMQATPSPSSSLPVVPATSCVVALEGGEGRSPRLVAALGHDGDVAVGSRRARSAACPRTPFAVVAVFTLERSCCQPSGSAADQDRGPARPASLPWPGPAARAGPGPGPTGSRPPEAAVQQLLRAGCWQQLEPGRQLPQQVVQAAGREQVARAPVGSRLSRPCPLPLSRRRAAGVGHRSARSAPPACAPGP